MEEEDSIFLCVVSCEGFRQPVLPECLLVREKSEQLSLFFFTHLHIFKTHVSFPFFHNHPVLFFVPFLQTSCDYLPPKKVEQQTDEKFHLFPLYDHWPLTRT